MHFLQGIVAGNYNRRKNRERAQMGSRSYGCPDEKFTDWYALTMTDQIRLGYLVRKPFWSEAMAVGSRGWVAGLVPVAGNVRIEPVFCSLMKQLNNCILMGGLPKKRICRTAHAVAQ